MSRGPEELLWHVTVLEALLGDEGSGVTKRLAPRLCMILAGNHEERQIIKKRFDELYAFRCDLVHGRARKGKPYIGHLRMGRALARDSFLWVLHFLHHVRGEFQKGRGDKRLPDRKTILALLDQKKSVVDEFRWLLDSLPREFPYVREWIE